MGEHLSPGGAWFWQTVLDSSLYNVLSKFIILIAILEKHYIKKKT